MNNNLIKVLIVDDEAKILEVVKSFLESKGFLVFTADNGRQALETLEREKVSLVLLDLMLPGMSGEEVCSSIRQKSRVAIIMVTAKAEEGDMLEGLNLGADDYITKPFSLKVLLAKIETVLRRSDNLAPLYNKISFNDGDLEIDLESRSVKKRSREIRLTPNEFQILAALVKYPNKVFTRDELISSALGQEFQGFDRAVDSHIKNIRQKIEDDSKKPKYVMTIHGVGYKFGGV